MTSDGNDHPVRLVRQRLSNKPVLGLLAASFGLAVAANAFAGRGPVDGWLSWGVLASWTSMVIIFMFIGVIRMASGESARVDDLPAWFIRFAVLLAGAYLGVAALLVVTP